MLAVGAGAFLRFNLVKALLFFFLVEVVFAQRVLLSGYEVIRLVRAKNLYPLFFRQAGTYTI